MSWRRLAFDTSLFVGLVIAAAYLGHELGPDVGMWLARRTGLQRLVVTSPDNLTFPWFGASFVLPPLFACLGGVLHRWRRRDVPSPLRLALVGAAVAVAMAGALALHVSSFDAGMYADSTLEPMISLGSLELARIAWQTGIVAGLLVCLVPLALRRNVR